MTSASVDSDAFALLRHHAMDVRTGWSLGIFGAIAEFMRAEDETTRFEIDAGRIEMTTDRGAMRVLPRSSAVIIDYEMPSRLEERRVRAVAACLPQAEARRAGRTSVAEIGPDADALRDEDRQSLLFDLGIGLESVEACVRTHDPVLIAALRAAEGLPLFEAGGLIGAILAGSPHRVFASALGRIEVFQPIPPMDGRSPDGPHTHVLPKLLAHRRTHAASIPIPEGLVPCLSVHPPRGGQTGRA